MNTADAHWPVGFYGKLPGVGDFVERRLPAAFVDAWDMAMRGLLAASDTADDDAQEHAQRRSVWRFALAPGVCGDEAWVGSVAPGRDRVGRAFPLVLAAALQTPSRTWFDAAQSLHDEVLSGGIGDVATFDRACIALAPDARADPLLEAWHSCWPSQSRGLWWKSPDADRPGDWLPMPGGLPRADHATLLRIGYAPVRSAPGGGGPEGIAPSTWAGTREGPGG